MLHAHRFASVLLLICFAAGGCLTRSSTATRPGPAATTLPSADAGTCSMLFFGSAFGVEVDDERWEDFVNREIAPRFPAGFTILDGSGQWREQGVVYRERSKILIVMHHNAPDASEKLEAIRQRFKERFAQESVMRVDVGADRISF
jgi:hypothetical protein